jgi:CubicO group peptidase (beta-lactamase class C family)
MFLALALLSLPQALPTFPASTPESQGIDPARLAELGGVVQGYVDAQKIVGAELLVIRNDHVVLHRGFGWRHREESVPMEPGGVFCLRSMTKTLVGAGVQMLIDADELSERDPVAKYLPSFDNDRSRAITVGQLLTHTSGLPLSSLVGHDLAELGGEQDVAALAGEKGPEFAPGSRFQYSDDGADTLGALIEVVSGKELEEFLRERVLEPLGMRETTGVMAKDHPLRARVCSNYAGSAGSWTRYWSPQDPPLFSFLLGSQGLYGTALDYARFLHLWKERGRAGGERLLSMRAVRNALEPRNAMQMPSAFEGLEARYGEMMQLWVDPAAKKAEQVVAFGHGGSDGTMAWVFPALDLMVLYFTQSRNGLTVIEIGTAVQRCLIDPLTGAERAAPLVYTADQLERFAGIYWEEDDQEIQAVLRRGDKLFVEFPGKTIVELVATPRRDAFQFALSPDYHIEFERDAEGTVVAFTGLRRGQGERMPRLAHAADLPSVAEVLERKKAASDWDRIGALGPVRIRSTLAMPALHLTGNVVTLVEGLARRRSETDYGSYEERALWCEGRAWSWSSKGELEELHDARRASAGLDHPYLPAADWRALYAEIDVLARVQHEGTPAFLLRAVPRDGHAHTWIVAAESGLPQALLAVDEIPGMGLVGSVTRWSDWREVGGLKLPFQSTIRFGTSVLGTAEQRWTELELGASVPEASFESSTLAAEAR